MEEFASMDILTVDCCRDKDKQQPYLQRAYKLVLHGFAEWTSTKGNNKKVRNITSTIQNDMMKLLML